MARPIAIAGTWPAAKPFTDLPVASQALSFSGTPGTGGSSITHYRSWILDKPTSSSAALSNNAIANPNLTDIDTPGGVIVFVQVADNRFDAGLTPDPWEHEDNAEYVSVADPRAAPDSAFVVVSVKTEHLDAEIPSAWERNWRAKFGDFVGLVDELAGDVAPLLAGSTSDASALHTHETIPETEIGDLTVTGDIELVNSAFPSTPAVLTGDYDSNTCAHLNGVADKDIILNRLATLGSGFSKVHLKNGAVEISGGLAAESDLTTDWIQSRSTNGQVTVRGRGTHDADLRTDIIQSDTNNAGIEVKGRGTHTYDLKAEVIQTDTINEATAAAGVTIDGLLIKDGLVDGYDRAILSEYLAAATTGTTPESLRDFTIPGGTIGAVGDFIDVYMRFSCANNTNSKTAWLQVEGANILTHTTTTAAVLIEFRYRITIIGVGPNSQSYVCNVLEGPGAAAASVGAASQFAGVNVRADDYSGDIDIKAMAQSPTALGEISLNFIRVTVHKKKP